MNNEFYCVHLEYGEDYYFKDKDKAYDFLWQTYLNNCTYESDDEMRDAKEQLNFFSYIEGIGDLRVCGFED